MKNKIIFQITSSSNKYYASSCELSGVEYRALINALEHSIDTLKIKANMDIDIIE